MHRRQCFAVLIAVSVAGFSSPAFAEITEFSAPAYKGHLLDWCLNWGSDCGAPAANAWCKSKGYDGAEAFKLWENVGKSTRVFGTGQVCDDESCDSFKMIACSKGDAPGDSGDGDAETTYKKPKIKGVRLDWCRDWGTNCGEPAALAFCKSKGDSEVVSFKMAPDIGKTRVISTGQVCDDPTCDGFKQITCK
jgi:hypothetical protein